MSMTMDENIKRWTAKRKAALIIEIIQGKTSVSAASRTFDLTSSEIESWLEDAKKGMIRKSKTDQYGKGRLVFGSERSAKLVRKWLRLKPQDIQPVFCAINHGKCEDRAICDRNVNDIIKRSVVKVKRCERPSDLDVSGHSLRVGAAQDLLIKGLRPRRDHARRRLVRPKYRL